MSDKGVTATAVGTVGSKGVVDDWCLECPWCGKLQDPAAVAKLAGKYALTDIGRDKMQTAPCDACGQPYALLVKGVTFRAVQAKG